MLKSTAVVLTMIAMYCGMLYYLWIWLVGKV